MQTDDFDFDLPRECIAQRPVHPRDAARLLVVGRSFADRAIRDLPDLLRPGDIVVVNDTKVIPARLQGRRTSPTGNIARVEITLHQEAAPNEWRAFARPAKKLQEGDRIVFSREPEVSAVVAAKGGNGEITLRFDLRGQGLLSALDRIGAMPLPPYIRRGEAGDLADRQDYQTIFAQSPGAVAAPTAGLHFTRDLLQRLDAQGIGQAAVTLHVGAGTFFPVRTERAEDHRMHSERGFVTAKAAETINTARARGGRIVAVGTTALRLLESAADASGTIQPFGAETDLFILPGYRFKAVDLLLTNFHLPRSTLFMLVCAFAGPARMKTAYAHGKTAGYRFYSYGDACLLERSADA